MIHVSYVPLVSHRSQLCAKVVGQVSRYVHQCDLGKRFGCVDYTPPSRTYLVLHFVIH